MSSMSSGQSTLSKLPSKRLEIVKFWWLSLFFASVQPAVASIYANLETKEVIGVKDGKPLVVITDGVEIVETTSPKAKIPPGTKNLNNGQKLKVAFNEDGFRYYSNLFDKLKAAEDELKATEVAHKNCLEARDYQGCVNSHMGSRSSSSSGLTEYERQQLSIQRQQLEEQRRATQYSQRQDRNRALMQMIKGFGFGPKPSVTCSSMPNYFGGVNTTCR